MDGANGIQSHDTPGSPEQQHIRLACQACQRKKIKCDRNFPCGQCTRSSLQCAPSTRKPRARHAGKRAVDSELRNRITKLESLVESLSGEVGAGDESPEDDADAQTEPPESSPAVGKYIGSPFWSSLTTEVQALREALEDEHVDEEAELASPSTSSGALNSTEYDLIVCPPGSVYVMPGALPEPTPELSATLCEVFCNNVDRLFRVFHSPTLRNFMIGGKPYLGHDHSAPCNRAVKVAVWFAATNSMSDRECQMTFGQSRGDQMQQFRRMVDVTMAQADLMNTTELATLQAFSVYLAASRLNDSSRRMWTLTAVAVRIARALGLHHEATTRSAFETEIRRRLWHQIRFLDVFTAMDRGSELLIGMNSFDTPRPRNVNDSEFDESSISIPEQDSGLTDMSFSLMAYDATTNTHRLMIPESKPSGETWQQRLEFAGKFAETVNERYLQYCDKSDPFERLVHHIGTSMMASMKLRAVRPMQKHVSSVPPRVDSPFVLKYAMDSLKKSEAVQQDPETQQWRWMFWVQWHALAVALAGLCANRDTEIANEAWIYVEQVYARAERHIADARNGMLWRPIEKLYRKASAFRDHRDTPTSSISPPQQMQFPPMSEFPPPTNNFDPNLHQSNSQMPGAMPMGGVLNGSMNLNLVDNTMQGIDVGNNDMSWMDFERIFEDMSTMPTDVNLGDMHWPQNVPPNEDWNTVLHPNLMR